MDDHGSHPSHSLLYSSLFLKHGVRLAVPHAILRYLGQKFREIFCLRLEQTMTLYVKEILGQ